MRRLLLLAVFAATPAVAQQVPIRWTSGYGQGTIEAMVRAADGSYIAFSCPEGREDKTPGISVQVRDAAPRGAGTLQIVVDGRNVTIGLENGAARGGGRSSSSAIANAAEALLGSQAQTFTAEIPELNWRQAFSLANVRDTLRQPDGRSILEPCLR